MPHPFDEHLMLKGIEQWHREQREARRAASAVSSTGPRMPGRKPKFPGALRMSRRQREKYGVGSRALRDFRRDFRLCGNCGIFNQTPEHLNCMDCRKENRERQKGKRDR